MKVLVTGASGFIGSAFLRRVFEPEGYGGRRYEFWDKGWSFVGLARNTDQRSFERIKALYATESYDGRFKLTYGDLNGDLSGICENVDAVVNFAARTFVDHSIRSARPFVMANVMGTLNLLEDARLHGVKRFIQVSTDEVYGAILSGKYTEESRLNPTNPYAAAKAGADCLAISYAHTYGLHTTITRTENNYGIYQHRQKVVPTFVRAALKGEPLPVYGDGKHSRMWLWVDDHVDAILRLLETDHEPGQVYHVAGEQEMTNIELAQRILRLLGKDENHLRFLDDHNIRPGHDRRYALDCTKLRAMGWEPKVGIEEGFERAVKWYADNQWWSE